MIILQTGVPGSGKTSSVIALLMKDESYTYFTDKDGIKKKRPLFVSGINELKLEHIELTDEQIRQQPFQDFLPYGSLVVIDEAQRLYPTRAAGGKVPPYIESLATHRHHGLDIVIITQHPSFLDSFVRRLVRRHLHIRILPVGRKVYEWGECVDQPDAPMNTSRAIESIFSLPKDVFDQYKSAEVHTKPKSRIPKSVIFLALFLPLLTVYGINFYSRMAERYGGKEQSAQTEQGQRQPTVVVGRNYKTAGQEKSQSLTAEMFVPTIPEKPESKPIYDNVRQVKQFERVAACIKGGKTGCTCYSDQATPIREIPADKCRQYAAKGLPFNPYAEQRQGQESKEANKKENDV